MRRPWSVLALLLALPASACFVDGKNLTSGTTTDATGETSGASISSTSAAASSTGEGSTTGAGEKKTVIVEIANGTSDALQNPGGQTLVDFNWITLNSPDHYGGLRFTLPEIPQGATITNAQLQLYIDGADTDSPRLEIYGELSPTPAIFSEALFDISSRPPTGASVLWEDDDLGMGWTTSPSLTPVLQELVDQENWLPGQSIVLILDATFEAADIPFEFRQSEHVGFAPKLGIEYLE